MPFKTKRTILAAAAAILGALASTAPAEAQWGRGYGWGGSYQTVVVRRPVVHRTIIVERPIIRRPVVYRTVVVERPRFVRHVVVHRPSYHTVWRHRVRYVSRPYYPGRPWRDRPRCYLPERYLCR